MLYPVILAGGSGTRLWPLSRKSKPKQVQPFIDKESLILKTYKRLRRGFEAKQIYVVTNENQLESIKKELKVLPAENYLLEPVKRNTGPAFALAATYLLQKDKDGIIVLINTDHYVKNETEFVRVLKLSEKTVVKYPDHLVLVGINPSYAETGYGYIKMGSQKTKFGKDEVFNVEGFKEKPDFKTAQKYLRSWEYLWNPTWVMGRCDTYLSLYKKYQSKSYKNLEKIQKAIGTRNEKIVLKREFQAIEPISIDYAILEKNKKMLVIPADLGVWADIGHWRTVKDILSFRENDNVVKGQHIAHDSQGNLIYSLTGKLVATAGVKNMIIVETEDAILVCPKERAQDVKKIVEELEKRGMKKYL